MTRNPQRYQQPTISSQQVIPHQPVIPYEPYHPVTPQQLVPPPVTFTRDESIDNAFIKLSVCVTSLIQYTNFLSLQRACIEKAKSPKMLYKPDEIVPVIKEAQSFQTLCSMLAGTPYWCVLDTRMMEAMATASMIPAARDMIENFKRTYYSMTLKEVAPYCTVVQVKPQYITMHEHLDRDPSQMTIFDLHKHRFYLEEEVVQNGPHTCTIIKITIGSVKIVWQIHIDYVYQTHSRLKTMHTQLSSQAIQEISIPAMKQWEGLPFLFPGKDMSEIGPIQSPSCLRTEPYPLPKGFEWCTLNSSNFNEIIQLSKDANPSNPIAKKFLKWFISSPQYKKRYLSGIRLSSSKKLVWILTCTPCNIRVEGKLLPMVNLQQVGRFCADTESWEFQISGCLIKETMRLLAFKGIFQALIFMNYAIPKPVITYEVYFWDMNLQPLPYTSPRTIGLRRMKTSDITKAFTLTNQYTSQFKIGQVFTSEEEFTHWFLSPLVDNIATYVVEVPASGIITDMFSFRTFDFTCKVAEVIAMVITSSYAEQLITDLLVCVQQQNAAIVVLPRFGLKKYLFKKFLEQIPLPPSDSSIKHQGCCLFYNYNYPEVDDDNHCLFGSRIHYGLSASRSS